MLLNGGFWAPGCPRLLTTAQLAELQKSPGNRLISIVDVSCDWEVCRIALVALLEKEPPLTPLALRVASSLSSRPRRSTTLSSSLTPRLTDCTASASIQLASHPNAGAR